MPLICTHVNSAASPLLIHHACNRICKYTDRAKRYRREEGDALLVRWAWSLDHLVSRLVQFKVLHYRSRSSHP